MTTVRARGGPSTALKVLDVAEALVQRRGYNGFSYADVAAELEITTASLHYHFPSKAELGVALIERYSQRFAAALDMIDSLHREAPAKLQAFVDLYTEVLRRGRMCLCGMLASDFDTLPEPMKQAVVRFFDETEAWLAAVLDAGREAGSLHFVGRVSDAAGTVVAALEGAMLVARPYGDMRRFERMASQLLNGLSAISATESGA